MTLELSHGSPVPSDWRGTAAHRAAQIKSGRTTMLSRIRTRIRRDEGASAVEYGLLVAAIAAVIVAVVFGLGSIVKDKFTKTSSCISAATSTTC